MPGGKATWVEYEPEIPQRVGTPAKGGQRSSTAVGVSGPAALSVGKVNKEIAKERGTY